MQNHYVRHTPLSQLICTSLDLGTWKLIVQCKDQVFFLHMRKVIGNDMDTFLWLDVWLKEATLLNLLDMHSPPAHSNSWKVSDIIEYGHESLKEPALQNSRPLIQQVNISINPDYWYWSATDTDVCSFKSA